MVALRSTRFIASVVTLSTVAESLQQYRRSCVELLEEFVGFEGAVWGRFDSSRAADWYARGVKECTVSRYRANRARYQTCMRPLVSACAAGRGVAQDLDVFDSREIERSPLYTELIRPENSCTALAFADLTVMRGLGSLALLLGRSGRFRPADLERLRDVLPAVAVGDAFLVAREHAREHPVSQVIDQRLSPREREVLEYATLGVTTQQIALALGTSAHTVKHQLRSTMQKLGAGSRAELVRIAMLEAGSWNERRA